MRYSYTLDGILEVPEGSIHNNQTSPRTTILPDGSFIKLWTVIEVNDSKDLTTTEAENLGFILSEHDVVIQEMKPGP